MTTCKRCDTTWTGLRIEHCPATSRVGASLWPASLAGADLDSSALERSPNGTRVGVDLASDSLGAKSLLVQSDGLIDIDSLESGLRILPASLFGVVQTVLLAGEYAKIRGVVVRAVAIDMVNLNVLAEGTHHEAMLVTLDVFSRGLPAEPDVAGRVDEPRWLPFGRFLVGAECADGFAVGAESLNPAGIASASLPRGSRNDGSTVDAQDVHDLIIQWSCHQTFTGATSGDMHRTGDHGIFEGPDRRRCLTPDEMRDKGMSQNARGHWTTGRAFDPSVYDGRQ